jgi:ADP-ribose pyrophosphatase
MENSSKSNNLPEDAKLVFQGKMFDIYQWEQKMFDGSVEIFERLKRPDSVCVIATLGDKIIIQEQTQPDRDPFISLPGGRNDQGEEDMVAAKRELLEETGYASDDFIFWKEFSPVTKIIWKVKYFIARDCQKIQEPELDSGEKIINKLVSFEDFLMLSENKDFRDRELISSLLYMRLHPEEQEKFRKLLFT